MRTGVNSTRQSIKKVRTKQTWEPKVGTVFSPFSVANGERKNEPIQTHSNVSSLGYARGSRWQNLMASLPKDRGNLHFLGWDFVCLFCRFNFQRKIHTAQGHGKGGWMSTKNGVKGNYGELTMRVQVVPRAQFPWRMLQPNQSIYIEVTEEWISFSLFCFTFLRWKSFTGGYIPQKLRKTNVPLCRSFKNVPPQPSF